MFRSIINFFKKAYIMNYYLVIIDTTLASQSAPAAGFSKAIQNVYIVLAADEKTAKLQVLHTFRHNQKTMIAFSYHTTAVSLQTITGLLKPHQALWSYVPMGGTGPKAPGQQKRIPTPESLLDPKAIVPPGQDYRNLPPMEGSIPMAPPYIPKQPAAPLGAVASVKPLPPPVVYDEQIKRDEAIYAKPVDPLMALLGDPSQMARLQALLGALNGGTVPANLATLPTRPPEDPAEVAMRFTEEASYDDSLTAIPQGERLFVPPSAPSVSGLPTKVPDNIPGLVQPDNQALARLQSNIKKVYLEDIPGQQ